MEVNKIIQGDCLEVLKTLPDESIDCCVTSPPYYGLRDYGHEGQIGLEETPEMFVAKMVEVFTEVKRVLKKEGTLWLNLGDSYAANGLKNTGRNDEGTTTGMGGIINAGLKTLIKVKTNLKPKDLIGIPWMVAFALRSSGWYLRQDIIWHKPNPMPESVTDRCTKSHEYIFLLSKSQKYYYDAEAIKQPIADASIFRLLQDVDNQNGYDRVPGKTNGRMKAVGRIDLDGTDGFRDTGIVRCGDPISGKANKRSVWTVTTKPFSEAHFATFPEDLIVDCIKAGCPENGIVLDPFSGAGTTALVARKLYRNYIGIELNQQYIDISEKRLQKELGMFI